MTSNLEAAATEVKSCLERDGHSAKTITEHRRCCEELRRHFREINAPFSIEAAVLWLASRRAGWSFDTYCRYRRALYRLDAYMKNGNIERVPNCRGKPLLLDMLPDWSRNIVIEYLALREREGWAESTLAICRSSCARFFRFLDDKGVTEPGGITPALVMEYHDTDPHKSSEGRNAYGTRVRKLLQYMAEEKLVPTNLHLAISTGYAGRRNVAIVLTPEMERAIYQFRESAAEPLALRYAAMVLTGLRTGLRASDIVNLRAGDIDWDKRKISIIQAKTSRAITLPMPTEVGNSIYRYVTEGRPSIDNGGEGYIFVRHIAPHSKLCANACHRALNKILSANGLPLPPGQGFHITRKTFATRLLTAGTPVDGIADALGHATRLRVSEYLSHDEAGMRMCPLPFAMIGGQS